MRSQPVIAAILAVMLSAGGATADDVVEFVSGATMSGVVTEIRKEQKEFDFEAQVGSRTVSRTYPFHKVHAVTYRGNRFVITPASATMAAKTDAKGNPIRSRSEIDRLIDTVGSTMPDWFDSTELNYPDTLDLSWPLKPPTKGWNNQRNMGQYIWDIINPNPARWRSGIKLVHHCTTLHQGDRALLQRDMTTLGRMYFDLMQDYPRAAYWLRKAGTSKAPGPAVMLAECYWRLGNRQLATQYLGSRAYTARAAKLYGNMGDLNKVLEIAARFADTRFSYEGFIAAGDALRQAGRFDQAIEFYNKVLADTNFRNAEYEKRFKARARESIEAIELFEQVDLSEVPDGSHQGSSTGYNGRIDVTVAVAAGEIKSVKVTQHREKQFYSALTDTEAEILKLQTVRGVDGTSGATITSRAIVNAAAKALAGAAK